MLLLLLLSHHITMPTLPIVLLKVVSSKLLLLTKVSSLIIHLLLHLLLIWWTTIKALRRTIIAWKSITLPWTIHIPRWALISHIMRPTHHVGGHIHRRRTSHVVRRWHIIHIGWHIITMRLHTLLSTLSLTTTLLSN